jgi:hypothetical protein
MLTTMPPPSPPVPQAIRSGAVRKLDCLSLESTFLDDKGAVELAGAVRDGRVSEIMVS